jgi:hypothetical protein
LVSKLRYTGRLLAWSRTRTKRFTLLRYRPNYGLKKFYTAEHGVISEPGLKKPRTLQILKTGKNFNCRKSLQLFVQHFSQNLKPDAYVEVLGHFVNVPFHLPRLFLYQGEGAASVYRDTGCLSALITFWLCDTFTIVIYDRNVSDKNYKTTILGP